MKNEQVKELEKKWEPLPRGYIQCFVCGFHEWRNNQKENKKYFCSQKCSEIYNSWYLRYLDNTHYHFYGFCFICGDKINRNTLCEISQKGFCSTRCYYAYLIWKTRQEEWERVKKAWNFCDICNELVRNDEKENYRNLEGFLVCPFCYQEKQRKVGIASGFSASNKEQV